ncbi:MAG: OmpA family protein [Cyclobacteriaceae bacterium]
MSFKSTSCRLLVLLLILASAKVENVLGQTGLNSNPELEGDQYFEAEQYYRAAQFYQLTIENDSSNHEAAFKLAESYRLQFDYKDALSWYQYVSRSSESLYPEATYLQAVMLKHLGRCTQAMKILDSLTSSSSGVPLSILEKAENLRISCREWLTAKAVNNVIEIVKLPEPVNSENYDYAPVLLGSDSSLLITSTRFSGKQKISYRFGENNANFFQFRHKEDEWKEELKFSKLLNTKASEGSGSYSTTRNEFYYTFCPENEPCQIYLTSKESSNWKSATPLSSPINLEGYNSKHPAITSSGDTLFFSSDRKGGMGGLDIWMSIRTSNGEWTTPVVLDITINTSGDEVTPHYLPSEDHLFFGSNGHSGYGGMDLFMVSDFSDSSRRLKAQLSAPFNSNADDSYLILGSRAGYLASNRQGDFDIYSFHRRDSQSWLNYLAGLEGTISISEDIRSQNGLYLKSNEVLPNELTDWIRVQSVSQKRLASGSTRFVLNSDVSDIRFREYQLNRQKDSTRTFTVTNDDQQSSNNEDALVLATFSFDSLELGDTGVISGRLLKSSNPEIPLKEQALQLLDAQSQPLKVSSSNTNGSFRFVNLRSDTDYSLVLVPNNGADTVLLTDFKITESQSYAVAQIFEPIYFDFNQHRLRPEAKKVLELLAQLYQSSPNLSIEINAYTDSLGNAQYNYLLSQERGEAAFQYLIDQGVDRAALVLNAKGISTSYKSTNAYVSQQLNRRVEFTIFGLDNELKLTAVNRILRPKVELSSLLQRTGMTVEELHSLNGRPVDALQPYKPLRIPAIEIPENNELFYRIIDIN